MARAKDAEALLPLTPVVLHILVALAGGAAALLRADGARPAGAESGHGATVAGGTAGEVTDGFGCHRLISAGAWASAATRCC